MVVDGTGEEKGTNTTCPNPLPLQEFEAGRGSMMACEGERATGFEPATSSLGKWAPRAPIPLQTSLWQASYVKPTVIASLAANTVFY